MRLFFKKPYYMRILCKLKRANVVSFAFLVLFITLTENADAKEKTNKEAPIYKADIPMDAKQRISILIGDDGSESNSRNGNVGLLNDEGTGNATGGGSTIADSTTWDKCAIVGGSVSKCCFQYTWPGFLSEDNIPAPSNATCDYLKKDKRDETIACFDPLVFTKSSEDQALLTPPNSSVLKEESERNNWNIYCLTQDSCVTYTFYNNDGSKRVANQTKFCGIVTDSNSGKRLDSGCYRQNMQGYIREVCVCSRPPCFGKASLLSSLNFYLLIFSVTVTYVFNINSKIY